MGGKKKKQSKDKKNSKKLIDLKSRKSPKSKAQENKLDPKVTELLSAVTDLVSKVAVERDTPEGQVVGRPIKKLRFFPDQGKGEQLKQLFGRTEKVAWLPEKSKSSVVCSWADQVEQMSRYLERKHVSWEVIGRMHRALSPRNRNILWGSSALMILAFAMFTVALSAREPWRDELTVGAQNPADNHGNRWLTEREDFQSGEVQQIADKFLNASTISEMLKWVRDPQRVKPLMEDHYEDEPFEAQDVSYIEVKEGVQLRGMRLVIVRCLYRDFSKRLLNLVDQGEGYRVDWESFVEYSEVTWDELDAQRPNGEVRMRLWVEKSDVFIPEYPPDEWDCYFLSNSDARDSVYGYINRRNPMAEEMRKLFTTGRSLPAVLGILYRSTPQTPGHVNIENLYHRGWLAGLDA